MEGDPPMTVNDDTVYVEVFYITTDASHDRFRKAEKIKSHAQCGEINAENWSLYDRVCEDVFSLENLPGECSIGVLLSHIYSKLQLRKDDELYFCSSDSQNPRKSDIGDIIAVDGYAYFIDVASTFTYVGKVEDLCTAAKSSFRRPVETD